MEKLLEYDLEEAHFYLYKADLYLKLPVTDINKGETGITLELGEDSNCHMVIWNDTKVIEAIHPAHMISKFRWCYEIRNNNNELLGYLAA
jgi:hypothetical protein